MPSHVTDQRHLAHDIYNQLAIISGHASLLQMSPNLTQSEQAALHSIAHATQIIQQQVRHLAKPAHTTALPDEKTAEVVAP